MRFLSFNSIPFITKNLILINILLFIFGEFFITGVNIHKYLDLYYYTLPEFKPHQFITHQFMHGDFRHILFNMFGLYFFGSQLENVWGRKRYINFYLICGIAAGLTNFIISYINNEPSISLGASGAVYGLMGAYCFLFPNTEIMIYFIPIKAKYLVPLMLAISIYSGTHVKLGDNTGHFAHVGGLVVGIAIVWFWNRKNRDTFY